MGFEVKADYSLVNLSRPPSHPLFPYPTGKDFCKHWVHNGFVNIDNEKMSKSKGNFKTLRSFGTAKDVRAFRYLVVTSQYRMPLNFSPDTLEGATNAVKKLDRFRELVLAVRDGVGEGEGEGEGEAGVEVDEKLVKAVKSALKQVRA